MDEIGQVVSVGDGIAGVYGLKKIQAGYLVNYTIKMTCEIEPMLSHRRSQLCD